MKPIAKQSNKEAGWTIVELLTVMSIIIILIGLLVPGLNQAKRFARKVKQRNQFHGIGNAIELFNAEWEGYPPSSENSNYCGAMKLAEAMIGQDGLGFNPNSRFTSQDTVNYPLVLPAGADLSGRRLYLRLGEANAYKLENLYGATTPYDAETFVLCDVYAKNNVSGKKVGMPILYYRADTSKTGHSSTDPGGSIYNYRDNDDLVQLGLPWDPSGGLSHPMASDSQIFYKKTENEKITILRPCRADSFILLSAGYDGLYGTDDDIFNFEK